MLCNLQITKRSWNLDLLILCYKHCFWKIKKMEKHEDGNFWIIFCLFMVKLVLFFVVHCVHLRRQTVLNNCNHEIMIWWRKIEDTNLNVISFPTFQNLFFSYRQTYFLIIKIVSTPKTNSKTKINYKTKIEFLVEKQTWNPWFSTYFHLFLKVFLYKM